MIANILDGIVFGLQLGLLATGLTLVYGLGGVLNMAYGQMAVVSAMVAAFAIDAGLPVVLAVILSLVAGGLAGLLLDRTLLQPVYRLHEEPRVLLSLLLTLGLSFIIDGFLIWRFPLQALSLHIGGGAIEILGVPMRRGSLLASAITLVTFAALFVFLRYTTLGLAVRSVIEDEEGARLIGIEPQRMMRLILILSGSLAALVAITRSMVTPVDATAGLSITVFALIVTVVGGLGSVAGAFLAGIILGIINVIAADLIGSYVSLLMLLVAAALTILIRPAGLLGVEE
ncbi:MAG: branched-chain amino acid ABC transporter permease [Ardenticatenaceae bacterium]